MTDTLRAGAIPASSVTFSPTGGIAATTAQNAIAEVDSETVKLTGTQSISGSKTFSGSLIIMERTTATTNLQLRSTDEGAGAGPNFQFVRDSASPAANDALGGFFFTGKNSTGSERNYGSISSKIITETAGATDGEFSFTTERGGSGAVRLSIGAGVYHPSATGGDKGANTINFGAVYDDDSLLTHLVQEFVETGDVDVAAWDAKVPDWVEPEFRERVVSTEDVEVDALERVGDSYVRVRRIEQRPLTRLVAVKNEDGTVARDERGRALAVEEEITEEVVTPARVIPRQHHVVRRFKAMLDEGFDPRDPANFLARMAQDRTLPGMPTEQEWNERGGKISLGEMQSRSVLAMECAMASFKTVAEQLSALTARVAALEKGPARG